MSSSTVPRITLAHGSRPSCDFFFRTWPQKHLWLAVFAYHRSDQPERLSRLVVIEHNTVFIVLIVHLWVLYFNRTLQMMCFTYYIPNRMVQYSGRIMYKKFCRSWLFISTYSDTYVLRAVRDTTPTVTFVTFTVNFGFWNCSCTVDSAWPTVKCSRKAAHVVRYTVFTALWTVSRFHSSYQNLDK